MSYSIQTNHPVAYESLDHLYPNGTVLDNNSNSNFILNLNNLMRPENTILPLANINKQFPYSLLDIGCAGGLFVKELSEFGIDSIGIEGSDISKNTGRAEWVTIPDRLFTCDATKPFTIFKNNEKMFFNVVTAWEVFEHFEKEDLPRVMDNINSFTGIGSLLICSVSNLSAGPESRWSETVEWLEPHGLPVPESPNGVELHRTKETGDWWLNFFKNNGFERNTDIEIYFRNEWVRYGTFNFVLIKTK